MRSLLLAFAFFPLALLAGSKGPKTPDALGSQLVNAFRKDDAAAFKKLFITTEEIIKLVNASSMSEDDKRSAGKKFTEDPPDAKAIGYFEDMKNDGISRGINWKNIRLGTVDYETSSEKDIKLMKITVNFTESVTGKKYAFAMKECLVTPRGLKLTRGPRLRVISPDDYYSTHTREMIQADSIRLADSLINAMNLAYQQLLQDSMAMVEQVQQMLPDKCRMRVDSMTALLSMPKGKPLLNYVELADSNSGILLISRHPIHVTSDNKSGCDVSISYSSYCSIDVFLRGFGPGKVWVENDCRLLITFTDGTWVETRNSGELNSFGDAHISLGDGEELVDKLRTKIISSIKIDTKKGVLLRTFTAANATAFHETMNCLPR
jgi:hypothetical protein